MTTEVIIAVDVGTTATKAAAIDREGAVHGAASSAHETSHPRPGWTEQSPEQWWDAVCETVARVCADRACRPVALAVTGQMQDLVALDANAAPVRPAILYSDTRPTETHDALTAQLDADRWAAVTGNVQDPSNVASKWRWLLDAEPTAAAQTRNVLLGAHSYVVARATGVTACDSTTASTTGLYDITAGRWSPAVTSAALLDADLLPQLVSSTEVTGALTPVAAQALGLPPGLPVVHGPGDAATTTLGVGAGRAGVRYAYLGTSGWVAGTVPGINVEPSEALYTLRHPVDGSSLRIGPMLSVGACVEWAARTLFGGDVDRVGGAAEAAAVPSRVVFLPYLAGERAPYRDASARGAYIGLDTETGPPELARAVLEGVSFALRSIDELLGTAEDAPLLVCGGGAKSSTWCQILADVFGRSVVRASMDDAGVLGAAMAGAQALGWHDLATNPWPARNHGRRFDPRPESGAYAGMYEIFRSLYPMLQTTFSALTSSTMPMTLAKETP